MSEEAPKSDSLVPRKDLDEYIADPFNQNVFQDLEEFEWKASAVYFFEWFYELAALIQQGKPSVVLQNLDTHKVDGPLRLWFVYHLRNRFRDSMREAWPTTTPEELPPAFHVIDAEYERLERLYPPDMFASVTNPGVHGKASAAVATGKMVNGLMINWLKKAIREGEEKRAFEDQIRQSEQERMREHVERVVQEVLKSRPKQNPEFTTNRQVIAVCYLLDALEASTNNSERARFIEFLTNKTPKEIYKRVLSIGTTEFTEGGKDAVYVRDWFRKLNLDGLAKKLDEILDQPREKF